jgi:ABC-type bacteriocin/lantibiotic exporter with double-glycine peptidase domain
MTRIVQNTWKLLTQRERKRFLLLTLLDIIISFVDIASLAALLFIVQLYIQPHQAHASFVPLWVSASNTVLIAGFLVFFCLKNILAIMVSRKEFDFIGEVAVRISAIHLQQYQQAPFSEFIDVNSSVQIRKIAFQPFEFCQYVLQGMQQLIAQSFLIAATLAGIIAFNARIFLLLLLILAPPVAGVFYLMKKKLAKSRAGIRSANERSFEHLLDALKGYVEGNIYDRNDFFKDRFVHHRKKFSTHLFDSLGIQAMPARIIEMFAIAGLFILIFFAQSTGSKDAFLLVGAFMVAAYKLIPGAVKLINTSGQIKAYEPSLNELLKETNITAHEHQQSTNIESIEFKNIVFRYGEIPVLENLNFTINAGDLVGITGRSGRGKTTLLNILLGFLENETGEIRVNDAAVGMQERRAFWPSIAYVRQQSFLVNESIIKNITLQEEAPDEKKLQRALEVLGLDALLCTFPEGGKKLVSENGKNISGGQQQRIALARAIYKDAQLLLMDEPFNELDQASVQQLLCHFRQLANEGKIVVLITHDQNSLSHCNKIISLDEG